MKLRERLREKYFLKIFSAVSLTMLILVSISTAIIVFFLSNYLCEQILEISNSARLKTIWQLDQIFHEMDSALVAVEKKESLDALKKQQQSQELAVAESIEISKDLLVLNQTIGSSSAYCYLYLPASDMAITTGGTLKFSSALELSFAHFDNNMIPSKRKLSADLTEQYRQMILTANRLTFLASSDEEHIFKVLPVRRNNRIVGYLCVNIMLKTWLEEHNLGFTNTESYYVYQENQLIATLNRMPEGEKALGKYLGTGNDIYTEGDVFYCIRKSPSVKAEELNYVSVFWYNMSIYQNRIMVLVILSNLVIVLFAMLMAFFVSKRLYRPIETLAHTMPGKNQNDDALKHIQTSVQSLMSSVDHLNDYVARMEPVINRAAIHASISGTVFDNEFVAELNRNHSNCCVFLFEMRQKGKKNTPEGISAAWKLLQERLDQMGLYVIYVQGHLCAVMYGNNLSVVVDRMSQTTLPELLEMIWKETGIKPYCAIGSIQQSQENQQKLSAVGVSYKHACLVMDEFYMTHPPRNVLKFVETENKDVQKNTFLSSENMTILEQCLKNRNEEVCQNFIRNCICRESEGKNSYHVKRLMGDILNTYCRIYPASNVLTGDCFRNLEECETLEDAVNYLCFLAHEIFLEESREESFGTDQEFLQRTREFICLYYSDNIGSAEAAKALGYSPGYFSSRYSKCTGETFSQALNSYRIEKAVKYMQETNLEISEIAERVGFYSYKTFSRAFKSYKKLSPSEFRTLLGEKKE